MNAQLDEAKLADAERKWGEATDLLRAGDIATAKKLLHESADAGFALAYLDLAREARVEGRRDEVRRCLSSIEELAARNDPTAFIAAYRAYQWRLGDQDTFEQERIANDYLRRGAELGDPFAQWMLAENYLGANGLRRDLPSYEFWIQKAIEGGEDEAVYSFAEYYLDNQRILPPPLKERLVKLAARFTAAAKLLSRIERLEKRRGANQKGGRSK